MLNPEDRNAIEGLFERIENVARAGGPRDEEAEMLIRQRLREAPASPYYMAQTILMQEHALRVAEQRIAELEGAGSVAGRRVSRRHVRGQRGQGARQPAATGDAGPWGSAMTMTMSGGRGGGGFLAGAAQTALGVTGGVLLGSAIAGMLTGDAQAEEIPANEPADEPEDN